jgi:FtsP/CotA-like multicopper oxidase with cupredoxin domain
MAPGATLAFAWSPKRPGNWLFHCHFIAHIASEQRMVPPPAGHRVENHALEEMAGLVTGIVVRARPGDRPETITPRRRLRLYANARSAFFGDKPGLGFVLQEGARAPARDSIRIPGTPIVLVRDEPVEITVVNRAPSAITVHWHGIELDSYYDGVPGWSGESTRVAPAIAPGDSFVVRMTPDRAGTIIYHTHNEEAEQPASGLYGPLIITGPGETWDATTDRVFLMGWGGPGPTAPPFLNGRADSPPVELEVGKTYRLRFINITASNNQRIGLLNDSLPVEWRRFAKDGWGFPAHQAVSVPAVLLLGAGETYDFSFTPRNLATLTLEITTSIFQRPPVVMRVPVVIRRP